MPPYVASITESRRSPLVRTQLDEAAFADEWAEGQALTADEAVALALGARTSAAADGTARPDGASRTRTADLLGAIQALSQLSYSPARGEV